MHICHEVAGIALAVGENNLCLRMVYEEAYQFATGISCRSQYSYSCHICLNNLFIYSLSPLCSP